MSILRTGLFFFIFCFCSSIRCVSLCFGPKDKDTDPVYDHERIFRQVDLEVLYFNNTLDAALDQVTGVQIIRFDTFSLLHQIHDQPASFNLGNVTEPCYTGFVKPATPADTVCANPQSYLFWDSEHPSTAMHSLMANAMLAQINAAVPEPDATGLLAAGLAVLALGRWRRRWAG